MKHRLIAVAAACAVAIAPTAHAQALTVNLGGVPVDDYSVVLDELGKVATAITETGATISAGGYSIVYDPSTLLEFEPEEVQPHPLSYQEGATADGRLVVLPSEGTYTSGFGPRWGAMHQGIDIGNDYGTPIRSVMDGTVINAGPARGFGYWVVVKHDGGEVSVYGHMQSYSVAVGDRVSAGQVIAEMGSEGQSTGPHLHFEIKPDGVNQVDPVPWFADKGIYIS
ncbi:M23 family metallopeptidase [Corynebacterium breve]|uniref:M23 family metallopeptidase n=1 Tax=Corynebacterium breve TaxID=3049799 RepID=A0ABY8VGE1_9CORY|nr:M23 family metallopeptidase [Corynebacterium breve]WIM68382.1 M23 family metallopeptidase [Corynebacterium breve]